MSHINQKIGDQLFAAHYWIYEGEVTHGVNESIVLLRRLLLDSNNSKMYHDLEVLQMNTSCKWVD